MNLMHLKSITDDVGLFEHCLGAEPRYEHGYCVDDVARAVVVLQRMGDHGTDTLTNRYLAFLADAQDPSGRVWNRREVGGAWRGEPNTHDHWGRALWAWGTTVRASGDPETAAQAYEHFVISARRRSPYVRSMVFAALGAIEVLHVLPGNTIARSLIEDAVHRIPIPRTRQWPWPEPRLTYANGAIPEVLILGGLSLGQQHIVKLGMVMLDWLMEVQTVGDQLSIIPHAGWGPGEVLPAFDQQPIEVSALVDACTTAYDLTSDPKWSRRVLQGYRWFEGANDRGVAMFDASTGAGFDGLTEDGRNDNRGAESTLAYLNVANRAHAFASTPA
jgi:hypothetical protein